jgi:hypothetical protein
VPPPNQPMDENSEVEQCGEVEERH